MPFLTQEQLPNPPLSCPHPVFIVVLGKYKFFNEIIYLFISMALSVVLWS